MSIPVVDCGNGIAAVAKPITDALKSVGGVWLRNHAVDMLQAEKTFEAGGRFFAQPADAKKPYARDSKHYGEGRSLMEGWTGLNTWAIDAHNKAELNEAYFVIKWHSERTQFHDEDARAAEVHKALHGEMAALCEQYLPVAEHVMRAVAGQLNFQPSDLLDSWLNVRHSGDNNTAMRFNYYPPVERDLDASDTARMGAHKDFHFLAFIMEKAPAQGLQACDNATGEWFDVPHIDNGILVVAGEQMELVTAGNIEALEHRVIVPSSADYRSRPRNSTTFFYMPDDGAMLRPLLEPKAGHKKAYSQEPVSARELVNRKLAESRYA